MFEESIHYGLAAASRVMCYAKGLEKNNCEVEIQMPFCYVKNQNKTFCAQGNYEGVNYRYLSFFTYNPFTRFRYPLGQIIAVLFSWLGYWKILAEAYVRKNDIHVMYIYRFSSFYTFLIQLLNSRLLLVSELCEIPYHDKTGIYGKIHRWIRENLVFPRFDAFVVISENLSVYIQEHTSKLIKSIKVPVLAEEKLDSEPLEPAQTLPESPYILHTGSLSDKKDGITGMLKAFALALPELAQEVKFVMTGYIEYSNDKLKILEVIDKFKIREKVIFTGFVSVKHLSHLQKHASLAIINKPFTEQNLYNFPTKLAEYMLHGIPVVATRYGEITNYLTDNVNVYFVDKGDPELKIGRAHV